MDRDSDPIITHHPPRLAQRIISALSEKQIRDALLGDLSEEFQAKAVVSRRRAWFWYWGQAMGSAPHLIFARLQTKQSQKVFFGLIIIVIATLFMLAWDIIVSRNSARMVATADNPPVLTVIRAIYFIVLSVGAAFCGILVARFAFVIQRTYWHNVTLYLAPVFLILVGLAMISAWERGLASSSAYLLMRTGAISLSMLLAAAIVFRLKQSRQNDH